MHALPHTLSDTHIHSHTFTHSTRISLSLTHTFSGYTSPRDSSKQLERLVQDPYEVRTSTYSLYHILIIQLMTVYFPFFKLFLFLRAS